MMKHKLSLEQMIEIVKSTTINTNTIEYNEKVLFIECYRMLLQNGYYLAISKKNDKIIVSNKNPEKAITQLEKFEEIIESLFIQI